MSVQQTISCAIIVLNEQRNMRECLESAKWMDEIILVDALSQDKTVEIGREYTQKIFARPWNGFGEQKNYAIAQATSEWVFILDADERIGPDLRFEVEGILVSQKASSPVAYYVPRKNFFYGRWMRYAGAYPDYQLRLFRKGVGKFDDSEPHNRFIFEGQSSYLRTPLDHYTERSISDHFRKFKNFTTLAARERGKRKRAVCWTDIVFRPCLTFWKYYVGRQGCRDGIHGLIICVFASMYTFVKYAKLWESLQGVKAKG